MLLLAATMLVPDSALAQQDPRLADELERLAARRVLFGHQSVGAGIVAGLERLRTRAGAGPLVRAAGPAVPPGPGVFVHALVERNGEPLQKLTSFDELLKRQGDQLPDAALFKLCYVDFDAATDVAALLAAYQSTFQALQRRHPRIAFVHFTAPLTTVQGGLRAALKGLLGRPPAGFRENERREEFNARLRATYRGAELFDLARLEATRADGGVTTATWRGRTVLALDPSSTEDGEHPGPEAQDRIARALVAHLAGLPLR